MGGRICGKRAWAGSAFHFTASFDTAELVAAEAPPALRWPTCQLIVDDNPVNRRILHTHLTRWRAQPTAVDCGAQQSMLVGRRKAGRPFRLVLLDVNMPDLTASRWRRRSAPDASCPVTIMMLSSSSAITVKPRGVASSASHASQADSSLRAARRDLPGARPCSEGPDGHAVGYGHRRDSRHPRAARAARGRQRGESAGRGRDAGQARTIRSPSPTTVPRRWPRSMVRGSTSADGPPDAERWGGLEATAAIRAGERETGNIFGSWR